MLGIIKTLMGGGIFEEIRKAYETKVNAQNDSDRIDAEVNLARLEARLKSHVAGGRWITFIQIVWAFPFILYNFKLLVWDKVLGWGITDPLSPELSKLQLIMVGFFFLTTTFKGITR